MFWSKVTEKKKHIFYVRHISLESCGFHGDKSALRDLHILKFFAVYRYPDTSPVSRFKNQATLNHT
jgi:hypothetical protein